MGAWVRSESVTSEVVNHSTSAAVKPDCKKAAQEDAESVED